MNLSLDNLPARKARVEMIPLIDCMFLLLVFFVYAVLSMTTAKSRIPIQLPSSETGVLDKMEHITITLDKKGEVFVDDVLIPWRRLEDVFRRKALGQEDLAVFIQADQGASLGGVMNLMDSARKVGLTQLSFEVDEGKKP